MFKWKCIVSGEESYSGTVSYRCGFGSGSTFSSHHRPLFRRSMRHIEHPGPYMCFSPGETQAHTDHAQIPQHLQIKTTARYGRTTVDWLRLHGDKKSPVYRRRMQRMSGVCQDRSDSGFYRSPGLDFPPPGCLSKLQGRRRQLVVNGLSKLLRLPPTACK